MHRSSGGGPGVAPPSSSSSSWAAWASTVTGTARPSLLRAAFASAAVAAADAQENHKLDPPPLSLLTTSSNSARFLTCITPVVRLVYSLPVETSGFWPHMLVGLALICIFPVLILIIPQLLIIGFVLHKRSMAASNPEIFRPRDKMVVNVMRDASGSLHVFGVEDDVEQPEQHQPLEQYLENLQFLQSLMVFFNDAYDATTSLISRLTDWTTDAKLTRMVLTVAVATIPLALALYGSGLLRLTAFIVGAVLICQSHDAVSDAPRYLPPALVGMLRKIFSALVPRVVPTDESRTETTTPTAEDSHPAARGEEQFVAPTVTDHVTELAVQLAYNFADSALQGL